jgi:hypothetical protein
MRTAIIMLINASVHVQPYVLMSTVEIMTPAAAHVHAYENTQTNLKKSAGVLQG